MQWFVYIFFQGFRDETFHGDDFASPFTPFATTTFDGIFEQVRLPNKRMSIFQEPIDTESDSISNADAEHVPKSKR